MCLPAVLDREGVDALHSPLFLLPAVLPARAIVTIHDAIPCTHPELSTPAFTDLWAEHAVAAAYRADAVICPTAAAKDAVVDALGLECCKVYVVPEAPHSAFLRPRTTDQAHEVLLRHGLDGRSFFLVVGALVARKAPTIVLEVLQERPDLPLAVFVGPPGDIDLVEEARRRRLSRRVRYVGTVSDLDLVTLLHAAKALAFPTLAEGFGLPVVEAFATRTPVVASSIPAVREVAGEAALLVEPGDSTSFGAALARVVSEPDLADELRAGGEARLAHYSGDRLMSALLSVYDGLEPARVSA